MSLIDAFMEDFVLLQPKRQSDGEGGWITQWEDGPAIRAAMTLDTSLQARVAEKDGVTTVWTCTTRRSTPLAFHDVLRRTKDGEIFRITSNGEDKKSPIVSSLDMSQCSAEKWSLPK